MVLSSKSPPDSFLVRKPSAKKAFIFNNFLQISGGHKTGSSYEAYVFIDNFMVEILKAYEIVATRYFRPKYIPAGFASHSHLFSFSSLQANLPMTHLLQVPEAEQFALRA